MNARGRSLALVLINCCAALLPADRAPWAAAMKAEVNAIEDGNEALSFAVGCVWGSIKERTFTLAFAARAMRFATICGMLALALLSAIITRQMIDSHAPSALLFGLTSTLFAAAAAWSYLRGPRALVQAASSVIPLYTLAYAFVSQEHVIADVLGNSRLYQALAIEGVVIWAGLLAGGLFMLRVGALPPTKRVS